MGSELRIVTAMQDTKDQNTSEVIIYKSESGPQIGVRFVGETAWLTQQEMAQLFGVHSPAVSKHIRNIYKEAELSQKGTISKMEIVQVEGRRTVKRAVDLYNLDVVIAVGYRVSSKRATQFRVWATNTLRDYLLKGFAVNQQYLKEQSQAKLKELEGAVNLLQRVIATRKTMGMEKELLLVMAEYTNTWTTLIHFDDNSFPQSSKGGRGELSAYEDAQETITQFSLRLGQDRLVDVGFGEARGVKFKQLWERIQAQDHSIAEAGALLFYSIIKEQPFVAGNKQIASLLLLIYLVQNNSFYNKKGERKLDDATMVALSVLIEESGSSDRAVMLQLIGSMINKK